QFERVLELRHSKGKLSTEVMERKRQKLKLAMTTGIDRVSAPEIHGLLRLVYEKEVSEAAGGTRSLEYYLCAPTDHFSWDEGDYGWGCGWRNAQILATYFQRTPVHKERIFDGVKGVPTVLKLQEWLELAWASGYDPSGALSLEQSVKNSKKWIGATEVAALYRSFGIKIRLLDFVSIPLGNNRYKPNDGLTRWVWEYFKTRRNPPPPPLYLQQEGHSRTIVGVERRGSKLSLILYDPAITSGSMQTELRRYKLQKLRKSWETFTKPKYQILCIEDGFMDERERELSKVKIEVVAQLTDR
ncbi:zinc finger with UFM1-specific peptidase domain-like, partial [Planoprotostelium fungivorum]